MKFELNIHKLAIKKHSFIRSLQSWTNDSFLLFSPLQKKKVLYMYADKYVYIEKAYKDKKKRENSGYLTF